MAHVVDTTGSKVLEDFFYRDGTSKHGVSSLNGDPGFYIYDSETDNQIIARFCEKTKKLVLLYEYLKKRGQYALDPKSVEEIAFIKAILEKNCAIEAQEKIEFISNSIQFYSENLHQ